MASEVRTNEVVIDEVNFTWHINPQVDGQRKGHGLVPRDWKSFPRGCYAGIRAVDVPLIDMSEWPDRIKEKEADLSRLSDVRLSGNAGQSIPSLDQDGIGYSHDGDTEVLTDKGWVRWPDWNHTDLLGTVNPLTHRLQFQAATEWHASEYKGHVYHSTNRRLDFGVTNYHRMYVRKWDESRRTLSDDYTFQNADRLGWYVGLLSAPSGWRGTEVVELEVPGDRRYDGDDFLSMVALVVSDGYAGGSEAAKNQVSFCCFDERYEAVKALAARVGFAEQPSRRGVWVRYSAPALAAWFREQCYVGRHYRADGKCVPGLVKEVSSRQIRHFLSWFADRDRDRDHYYSSSKRVIDDLQELFLRVGRRGSISERGPRTAVTKDGVEINSKKSWELHVGETDQLCLDRKRHIETDRYRGLVYCATVPNGLLVTRRNGSVLVSGNCWAHSSTQGDVVLRAKANQPFIPLSAFAVAATLKHGQDEGGWGAQSTDFIIQRGVPSQAFWPQGDRDYRKYDKPEVWANAALHKFVEEWVDTAVPQYDRDLSRQQVGTLLLTNTPVVVDYNWWSHSVLALDLLDLVPSKSATDPLRYGIRIWNSWSDSWSDRGMGVLKGTQAWPDGAVAPSVTTVSTN